MDNGASNTLAAFTTLLTAAVTYYNYPDIDPNLRATNHPNWAIQEEYDFIIIGAGSAGNVLANRLSEISGWTVLLVEAGGDETVISDTPVLNYNLWFSDMDWNYTTVPQQNACGVTNGTCIWPRGRVIGGSSVVNDFVFARGNRWDYNNWADMGNTGWSFEDVLPYFLKSENNKDPNTMNSPFHSRDGMVSVDRSPFLTPLAQSFINAGGEMGFPYNDVNGERQIGFMIAQGTIINGTRCSTGKAYLRPARGRRNLVVAMRAHVTKINIDPQTKTATGITFVKDGQYMTVNATKEVIVSAGTINSPQLLMLSGIGPAEHLQELGIPVIQNLRVGDNLHDHVGIPVMFNVQNNVTINWRSTYENFSAILDYAQNGKGPLTTLLGVECVAFINLTDSNFNGVPDVEFLFSTYVPTNRDGQQFAVVSFFLHPESRGTIRLRDTNPTSMPLIDPRYLTSQTDIQAGLEMLQIIYRLAQTNSLQQFGTQFNSSVYPLCSNHTNSPNEFSLCLLTQYSVTIYHPVGTCKMGPSSDTTAVVNPKLQVYGVNNLRVIDSSVIPVITSANINSPTIMIAERAADIIKQDHGQLPNGQ
ncbi:glucose dehydrogenase [FAD, quinone]-like [Cimex lectularius]|uniref:Glucose-methanol-choline oxidoreductase N-terminal domain-containing protein n=1 Tax=Cimex lectularius TaxID=79782 RepID=A0A8I6SC79_CIMLE|nr:glucose dehydrogenase [FAD, quinone]-like [Cimex lectularius]